MKPPVRPAGPPPPVALRPAVFIDKDGTLIRNVPYNVDPARLEFMPGAGEALAALAAAGYRLIVVTNQSGIALGHFDRASFARLQQALERRLHDEAGVTLQDVLLCPHAPGADGAPACLCRKPAPGMLLRAARCHAVDLARSWMVGDTLDDVEAGRRAGCRALLFDSGGETVWRASPLRTPHGRCTDWQQVCAVILGGASAGLPAPAPHAVEAPGVEPVLSTATATSALEPLFRPADGASLHPPTNVDVDADAHGADRSAAALTAMQALTAVHAPNALHAVAASSVAGPCAAIAAAAP